MSGVSYTGAEVYASSGNRSPFTANLKDFGPRLGFSWQPVKPPGSPWRQRILLWPQRAHGGRRGA